MAVVPLLALVGYAAVDRYEADRSNAELRASSRAQLYAALLAREDGSGTPSSRTLARLLRVARAAPDSALVVFDRGKRVVARAGAREAGPSVRGAGIAAALARQTGAFTAGGADGVVRVWGLARIGDGPSTVAFGFPEDAAYGPARAAPERDLVLAFVAAALALLLAVVLAGRVTAPLRRLAGRMAGAMRNESDIGRLERGFGELGAAVQAGATELERHAQRLTALREIDRAILAASTPAEVAQAALARLRDLVDAARAEVVLFDRDCATAGSLAIAAASEMGEPYAGGFAPDGPLLDCERLRAGHACVCGDLDALAAPSALGRFLRDLGVRSHAAVPLSAEGELLGAVNVGFVEPQAVTADALAAAGEVADSRSRCVTPATRGTAGAHRLAMEGILLLDDERRFAAANEPAAQIFGRPRDELIGLHTDDVIAFTSAEVTLERAMAEGSVEGTVTVELRTESDGSWKSAVEPTSVRRATCSCCSTEPDANDWRTSCARRRGWRPSGSSPAASRTTSTTS